MAITVTAVFNSGQTDHVSNPINLVLGAPIPIGAKALLCNASTIDDPAGISPGAAGWGGIVSVTDSRGNVWVRDVWTPVDAVNTFTTVEIFRSDITTALQNGDVLTVVGDTRGLSMEMGILDCRGLAAGAPTQKSAASNMSATTSWTSASVTTSVADSLLVAVAGASGPTGVWWTAGGSFTEQIDRGDGGTIQRAVAVQTQIVAATGTYTATGTASPSSTGNMQLAAYQGALSGQSTGTVQIALGAILKPDTRTGHELHVRARKANPSEVGSLRLWLYEAGALRSGPYDVGLTDNFTNSIVPLLDADVARIGSYANLEVRMQGVSASGAITPQVSFLELQTPGASIFDPGQSEFPDFPYPPITGRHPLFLHPGSRMRRVAFYDRYEDAVPAGNIDVSAPAASATADSTAAVVSGHANVTGVAAVATASSTAATVTGTANVTGVAAVANASGPTPTVTAGTTISPATAVATAASTAAAVTGTANVTAVAAVATASATAATVAAGTSVSPAAAVATASSTAATLNISPTVSPAAAVATASGTSPTITGSGNVTISPAAADATASSTAAVVSGTANVTVTAAALATASSTAATVSTSANVTVSPASAVATASSTAATVAAGTLVSPAAAQATGSSTAAALTITTTISPAAAIATASGTAATVLKLKTITVPSAASATASATAPTWSRLAGATSATATATGPTPTIVVFNPAGPKPGIGGIRHGRQGHIAHIDEGALV